MSSSSSNGSVCDLQSEYEDEDQSEFPDFDSLEAETGEPVIEEPVIEKGLSRREKRRLNFARAGLQAGAETSAVSSDEPHPSTVGEGHQTLLLPITLPITVGEQSETPNAPEVVKKKKKNRRVTRKDKRARLARLEAEGKSADTTSEPCLTEAEGFHGQGVGTTTTIGDMAESDDGQESRNDGETSEPDNVKSRQLLETELAQVKQELLDAANNHEKSRWEWVAEKSVFQDRIATKDVVHETVIDELKGQIAQLQSSGAAASDTSKVENAELMAQVKKLRQEIDSRELELQDVADSTYRRVVRTEYNDLLDQNRQLTEKVNSFEGMERTYKEKLKKKEEEIQRGTRNLQLVQTARDAATNGRNDEAAKVLEKKKEVDQCKKEIDELLQTIAKLEAQVATSDDAAETLRKNAITADDQIKILKERTAFIAEVVAERDRFFEQVEDVHKLLSVQEDEIQELNLLLAESNDRNTEEDNALNDSKNLSVELQELEDNEAQEPEAVEVAAVLTSPAIHVVVDVKPTIESLEPEADKVAAPLTTSTIMVNANVRPSIDTPQALAVAPILQLEEDESDAPPTLPDDRQSHLDRRVRTDSASVSRRRRRNAAFDPDRFRGQRVYEEHEVHREPGQALAEAGVQTEPQSVFAVIIYRSIDPVRGWLTVYTDLYTLFCLWFSGYRPTGPLVLDGTIFGDRDGHIIDIKTTPLSQDATNRAQQVRLTETRRSPPPLFENLVALCLHLIVYVFLLYSIYMATMLYPVLRNERAVWFGANDLTRRLVVNWRNSMSCSTSGGGSGDGGRGAWADLFFDINQGLQVNRILPG